MKKIKLPSFGTWLIIFAALSNIGRWVGMYLVSDNAPAWVWLVTPYLNILSALSTALVIAGGLSFIAHRLGNLQPFLERKVRGKDETKIIPNIRFWTAAFAALGILSMSAFLLPPYIRMMLPKELIAEIGNQKVWSVMSVLVGDLVIVAIAMVDGKSAGFTERPQSEAQSKPATAGKPASGRSTTGKTRSAKGSGRSANYPCSHAGAGCARTFASQNAANAHGRTCDFKPTISMPADAVK
jgi:hypothetical protein